LVDDSIAIEEEDRDHRYPKRLSRGRQAVEFSEICSQQLEFDDDRVVRDVEASVLVALVGERGTGAQVIAHDLVVAVVDLTGGHDLVMRMAVEGGQCRVELLGHLRVHVFADDCEASLSQIGGDHESPRTCLLTSKLRYSGVPGQGPGLSCASWQRARASGSAFGRPPRGEPLPAESSRWRTRCS